jgi:hypothetical protein
MHLLLFASTHRWVVKNWLFSKNVSACWWKRSSAGNKAGIQIEWSSVAMSKCIYSFLHMYIHG